MSTRREFIQLVAASSGALVLGVRTSRAKTVAAAPFQPNVWLRIEPDGAVVIKVGKSKMGRPRSKTPKPFHRAPRVSLRPVETVLFVSSLVES